MGGGLLLQEDNVAHGIGALVLGEVSWIGGAFAWGHARVDFNHSAAGVETHGVAIGTRVQPLADKLAGQRVQRLGQLRVLIAPHLGLAVHGDVVRGRGGGQQVGVPTATARSTRALSLGLRTRVGSTWKPRACAYSRKATLMTGSRGSACCTMALVLSGNSTRKMPPKNSHAASHASLALSVVSRSIG
jgi:hypothetical protein